MFIRQEVSVLPLTIMKCRLDRPIRGTYRFSVGHLNVFFFDVIYKLQNPPRINEAHHLLARQLGRLNAFKGLLVIGLIRI